MSIIKSLRAALLCLSIAALASPASAGDLPAPTGPVVLTVTGKIARKNTPEGAAFDMKMLEELKGRAATLETPWTKGKVTFQGPLGRAVLEAAGATGTMLKVRALNDYAADVPVEDFLKHDTILATRLDGKPMSVRDKGPLFMIYPFDLEPALYNEKYFSRSVWQIKSITVE